MRIFWACLAWCAVGAAAWAQTPVKPPRYWALFDNGDQHAGELAEDWFVPEKMPRLQGRNLLDEGNPARVVWAMSVQVQKPGPYVEMINGDILPGTVRRFDSASPSAPDALVVESVHAGAGGTVRVRANFVKRIVATGTTGAYTPGLIKTTTGKKLSAEKLRLAEEGVRGLTQEGVEDVTYANLAEAHLEMGDPILAWRDCLWWPFANPQSFVARIRSEAGAEITFPREMARMDMQRHGKTKVPVVAAQPLWALDPVVISQEEISLCSYWRRREIPVSQLPLVKVTERAGISHWPWQRNRDLRGGTLRADGLAADLGLATHSYCQLEFQLPAGSEEFVGIVGIDPSCDDGGCARARVHRDDPASGAIWQSDFLRGSVPPTRVGPLDLKGAKQLALVTDFAHQDRPKGADPLDIRDFVNWLHPLVRVGPEVWGQLPQRTLSDLVPPLAAWSPASAAASMEFRILPYWRRSDERFLQAFLMVDPANHATPVPLRLTRKLKVDWTNSLLTLEFGRPNPTGGYHEAAVTVNAQPVACLSAAARTDLVQGDLGTYQWLLSAYAGQEIELQVEINPQANGEMQGVLLERLTPSPVVRNLPLAGVPIQPAIPLESLAPAAVEGLPEGHKLQAGKLTSGAPLTVCEYPLTSGYGLRTGSSVTYRLEDRFGRFVAVIGLPGKEAMAIGPYEILLDGQPYVTVSEDNRPSVFGRGQPGMQIDVPIPLGYKTMTIRLTGQGEFGALGSAGFQPRDPE